MKQPLKVYLAGGFHTNWQEQVETALEAQAPGCFIIMNPKKDWGDKIETIESLPEDNTMTLLCETQLRNPQDPKITSHKMKITARQMAEEEKEASDKALTHSPWWPPDKFAIEKADIVFFNVEDYGSLTKMRGTGDIFEAGIAYALGKLVVFVNQVDHRYYRQFERLFQINTNNLEDGIKKLLRLRWLAGRD